VADRERYQELLELLGRGLIRYAEKRGLVEQLATDSKEPDTDLSDGQGGER